MPVEIPWLLAFRNLLPGRVWPDERTEEAVLEIMRLMELDWRRRNEVRSLAVRKGKAKALSERRNGAK